MERFSEPVQKIDSLPFSCRGLRSQLSLEHLFSPFSEDNEKQVEHSQDIGMIIGDL